MPGWKNYNDQRYSCSRNWRLSASWEPIRKHPESPLASQHYSISGFKGDPHLVPHYAEIDTIFSGHRCKFFQYGVEIYLSI